MGYTEGDSATEEVVGTSNGAGQNPSPQSDGGASNAKELTTCVSWFGGCDNCHFQSSKGGFPNTTLGGHGQEKGSLCTNAHEDGCPVLHRRFPEGYEIHSLGYTGMSRAHFGHKKPLTDEAVDGWSRTLLTPTVDPLLSYRACWVGNTGNLTVVYGIDGFTKTLRCPDLPIVDEFLASKAGLARPSATVPSMGEHRNRDKTTETRGLQADCANNGRPAQP